MLNMAPKLAQLNVKKTQQQARHNAFFSQKA
jgi:hypothetical protein